MNENKKKCNKNILKMYEKVYTKARKNHVFVMFYAHFPNFRFISFFSFHFVIFVIIRNFRFYSFFSFLFVTLRFFRHAE